jgi:hypothetical protein
MDTRGLWVEAYQGEVLGETLFGYLAEREDDPDRRRTLEVMTTLERATKELAEPLFERHGWDRGDTDATVAGIVASAGQVAEMGWEDFLRSIPPVADTFLVKYRQLVAEVDDPDDRAVAEAYVAHELALVACARRALGEEDGDALEPILSLPHVAASLGAA